MRAKKFLIILLTALIFLSAAVLGVSTAYRISEVTVEANTVSEEAKREAAELQERLLEAYEKQSAFFVDRTEADEIVAAFPYFRITAVERAYPNRLIVRVSEDEEVYAISCGDEAGNYYILGGDGTVLGIRSDYANRSETLSEAKNVLLKGLRVTGEKGQTIAGDPSLDYLLPFCQRASELLNGIRRNILSVELVKSGGTEDTVMLALTTYEGVKIYVRNPSEQTMEKANKAIAAYLGLSDAARTMGMIAAYDSEGDVQTFYSAKDEFAGAFVQ